MHAPLIQALSTSKNAFASYILKGINCTTANPQALSVGFKGLLEEEFHEQVEYNIALFESWIG